MKGQGKLSGVGMGDCSWGEGIPGGRLNQGLADWGSYPPRQRLESLNNRLQQGSFSSLLSPRQASQSPRSGQGHFLLVSLSRTWVPHIAVMPSLHGWASGPPPGYGWGTFSLKSDGASAKCNPSTTNQGHDCCGNGQPAAGRRVRRPPPWRPPLTCDGEDHLGSYGRPCLLGGRPLPAPPRIGDRPVTLAKGGSLLSSMGLGAGTSWTDSGRGISGETRGHPCSPIRKGMLREQGLAASFAWEPTQPTVASLSMSHAVDVTA